jgi:rhodanese-related sulfurtransferase
MKNVLLVVALIVGALFGGYRLSQPDSCGAACEVSLSTVEPAEFAKQAKEADIVVLDVRTKEEFEQGHISGAQNIDFNNTAAFNEYVSQLDASKKYLIYCRSGNRSGQALKIMQDQGFTQITNLDGGIQAWQSAGYELEK